MNKKELEKEQIKVSLSKNPKKIITKKDDKYEEKTFMNKYSSEDKRIYIICFYETKSKIKISLTNQNEDDLPFVSRYELDYLNENFGKTIQFKSIEEFRMCLKANIDKNLLSFSNFLYMISFKIFLIYLVNQR